MISGDNDIKLLRNAFKRNGYIFWSYTLDAILEMRSIQNFVSDIKKVKRNRTSPSKDPGWGGSHIFGNSKYVKRVQPSTDILHTFRLISCSYSSLSIHNPNVSPLINSTKVFFISIH